MSTRGTTLTVEAVLASVDQLDAAGKRALAIQLLRQFDSDAVLEIIGRLKPAGPDYEDAGPLTDEELTYSAAQLALALDQEEAAYEQARAR